ncbi:MAG: Hcp family type VI secretion system effector [Puniceicoccaceae bacterium]
MILGLTSTLYGPAYIKIEGVDGESKDKNHDQWIDVLAIDWGMSRPAPVSGGGGISDLVFDGISATKYIDKSTPLLMQSCATANPYPAVEVHLTRRAGAEPDEQVYLVIKLENVLVTSVSTGGSGGEDRLTENVTLNFGRINFDYQKTADGAESGVGPFIWDVARGTTE